MNYQIIQELLDNNFQILENNGRSIVKLWTDPTNNKQFAVKFVKKSSESLQIEYNLLQMFSHANIIKASEVGTHDKQNYLVTEYMNKGDLVNLSEKNPIVYVQSFREDFRSEKFWRTIFLQSIQALRYLHGQGYAHLDVKPENFLINDEFVVKLIDFEFCFAVDTSNSDRLQCKQICGTKGYYAPEIKYTRTPYDPTKCDVFSLAVMMLSLLTGTNVLPNIPSTDKIYSHLKSSGFEEFWKLVHFSEFLSAEFKDLIENMMKYDPNQRISIKEAENHPWFKRDLLKESQLKDFLRKMQDDLRIKEQREKDSKYESLQKKIKKT